MEKSFVRFLSAFAFAVTLSAGTSVLAQHGEPPSAAEDAFAEASAEAGESAPGHVNELEHLHIRGIGDIFSIPGDLPEEIHEERVHLRTQFIASVINFLFLLTILGYVANKKLGAALVARRDEISKSLEEAKALKAEAEAKHAEYKKRLLALDDEVAQIREEMLKAGRLESERIVEEAEKKAARLRKDTEFLIEQRMKTLRADVTREAVAGAVGAAEVILREKTTADDQQRLSRSYVAQLDAAVRGEGGLS
jgi:F-type H+-transporting ATPase subunit b